MRAGWRCWDREVAARTLAPVRPPRAAHRRAARAVGERPPIVVSRAAPSRPDDALRPLDCLLCSSEMLALKACPVRLAPGGRASPAKLGQAALGGLPDKPVEET